MPPRSLTAVIHKEGEIYVALCPELDITSQGNSRENARANLIEAVELFLEAADPEEVEARLQLESDVTRFEVTGGKA